MNINNRAYSVKSPTSSLITTTSYTRASSVIRTCAIVTVFS